MRHVVLHIGLHKTGSTHLQHAFYRSRAALAAQGWDYSDVGLWQKGHHQLADAYGSKDEGVRAEASGNLRSYLASTTADKVLISSERFDGLHRNPGGLSQLAEDLGECRVDVIIFLRRRSNFIYSRWQQRVQAGLSDTFPEFALRHALKGAGSQILDFMPVIDAYANAFGDDAIRLAAYSTIVESDHTLLEVFTRDVLDLPPGTLTAPTARTNTAFTPLKAELIRLAQASFDLGTRGERARFTRSLADWMSSSEGAEFIDRWKSTFPDHERNIEMSAIDRNFIGRDREMLTRFAERGVGLHGPTQLFPPLDRSNQSYAIISPEAGQSELINEFLGRVGDLAAEHSRSPLDPT